jgi:hypothetical protein
MADFLGLSAYVTMVIGFTGMNGKHESENIQPAVEKLVNQYTFDKKKIIGNSFYKKMTIFDWYKLI